MADQIDLSTAMQIFDTEVTLRYQNRRYLASTINERHGTTGIATNVPVSDEIEMSSSNFAPTDIPVTPVDETNVLITPTDYRVKTVIGGGEKTLFAYDKIVDHAKLHALAAARLDDFLKINAIFSSPLIGSIYTVPVGVGVNTGMNSQKLADALATMESKGVDVGNYSTSLWCPALLKKSFFADQQVTNIFFTDHKPLTDFKIKVYEGADIRFLGEAGSNKIPSVDIGGGVFEYLVPLVNEDAIVQIYNRDISTSISWVPWQDRWELLTVMTSGASIIQTNGIALITANTPFVNN